MMIAYSQIMKDYEKILEKIREDKESGSREIANDVINCFKAFAEYEHADLIKEVKELGSRCIKAQPDMGAVRNVVEKLIKAVEEKPDRETIQRFSEKYQKRMEESLEEIIEQASDHIREGANLLSHSRSSTVEKVLTTLHDRGVRYTIFVTESLPGGEGRTLVKHLRREGIKATTIHDDAVDSYIDDCDLVLFGADFVESDRILNKIGSKDIAEKANKKNKHCLVIVEASKFGDFGDPEPDKIFEWVPRNLVTLITNRRSSQDHK